MTTKETAEALGVDERTVRRHAAALGLTENGKQTNLDEKAVTIIKTRIERSGRNDLDNVVQLPNTTTDLEMMVLDARVSEWKTRKIEELQRQLSGAREKIAFDAPKVEFYDAVTQSLDTLDFTQVAKVLNLPGMGRNKMLSELRGRGFLRYDNSPYQEYVDRGYFKQVEMPFTRGNVVGVGLKTVVFQKGVDFIRKELTR